MNKVELEERTRRFALAVVRFVSSLPNNKVPDALGRQLLRSGTSIGANYREANRAESRNDFIHKIAIVEKEAAETQYWLQVLDDAGIGDRTERQRLLQESGELLAIFTASGKTAKFHRQSPIRQSAIRNPPSEIL
jgi:four helix bundle protein